MSQVLSPNAMLSENSAVWPQQQTNTESLSQWDSVFATHLDIAPLQVLGLRYVSYLSIW